MPQSTSDSTTGQLPPMSTSEDILDLITAIRNSNDVTGQLSSGVPVRDCIRHLFEQIRPEQYQQHNGQLEHDFAEAVATAILDHNHSDDSPRLDPKASKVGAIRRTVFLHGDTILVAWTGYRPILVTQTVSLIMQGKDESMWSDIAKGIYTHVIVGPQQANQDRFLRFLRKAEFNQGLAMVAIDELHMVWQWKYFQTPYPDVEMIRGGLLNYTQRYTVGWKKLSPSSIIVSLVRKDGIRDDYRWLRFLLGDISGDNTRQNANNVTQAIEKTIQPQTRDIEGAVDVPAEKCCNGCHPELGRLPLLPGKPRREKAPREGSMSWFAWQEIRAFCKHQARTLSEELNALFEMPACVIMPNKLQWKLARLFEQTDNPNEIERLVGAVLQEPNGKEEYESKEDIWSLIPTIYAKSKASYEASGL
ncbi:hypothetical protein F4811DRAFT_548929 [Daldinia bambusicola]|nr:hypothetical protein F4811DRAFT_548929 [Daldinia bambusicola]